MKRHVKNKHEGKVHQCNKCDHTSASQIGLKIHQLNKHEGVRFKCPKCDYESTQKGNLPIHMQAVHEGIVHACSLCDYETSKKKSEFSQKGETLKMSCKGSANEFLYTK